MKSRLTIEAIEPRLLFSADLPAWQPEIDSTLPYTEHLTQLVLQSDQSANESVLPSNTATTVVIIDPATPDYQTLVEDIKKQSDSVAIYLLDGESDGLAQITAILGNHSNIESLQIISHGADGQLDLGNSSINSGTLLSRAGELNLWRSTFTHNADILIYGCDIAATDTGEQFVNVLGYLTSTDVAASNDKTGSALSGADWALEYKTGSIESTLAVSDQLQHDYTGVLNTITVQTTVDNVRSGMVIGNPVHDVEWLKAQLTGDITLREAIIAANNTNSGTTTITLGSGTYLLSLNGAEENQSAVGDLDINSDIVIVGDGMATTIIDGNDYTRIFDVHSSGSLSISEMQVTGGNSTGQSGGAVLINVGGTFTSDSVVFHGNTADDGGAIFNSGTTTLNNVSLHSNTGINGGAIESESDITISNSSVYQNIASSYGGGLVIDVTSSTTGIVVNTTVSGNSAGIVGGGIYMDGGSIINSTVVNNTAPTTGGIDIGAPTTLQNVIAANNTSTGNPSSSDYRGIVTSDGGNIIENTATTGFNQFNDATGIEPLLGSLQDNGGSTLTHALLASSAGIDSGITSGAPALDQRGEAREGVLDSGSYEYKAVVSSLVVTTLSDINDGDTSDAASLVASQGVDGSISLREAIIAANNDPNPITITFDISDPLVNGEHRLVLNGGLGELPVITGSVLIDGSTESDYVNSPVIVIDGSGLAASAKGLQLNSVTSGEVRGLSIVNFGSTAISLVDSDFVSIVGNYLGTTGSNDEGNLTGIELVDSSNIQIGGNTEADRNVISGNTEYGILLSTVGNSSNSIQGNYIGTDNNGQTAIANGDGITLLAGTANNTIGGESANQGNLISGNSGDGITLVDNGTSNNTIQGNYIGVDVSGNLDLGNGGHGIHMSNGVSSTTIGGDAATGGNVISGNARSGIYVDGSNIFLFGLHTITGNFIGTNFDGTLAIGNDENGISLVDGALNNTIGSTNAGQRNVISGNGESGIELSGSSTDNLIIGNLIGTDSTGTSALGNAGAGVTITSGAFSNQVGGNFTGQGNVISANNNGVVIEGASDDNDIFGNNIGTNLIGNAAIGNNLDGVIIKGGSANNTIGGFTSLGVNQIAGNGDNGIRLSGTGTANNFVYANFIGIGRNGTTAIGNSDNGVSINSGATNNTINSNVISGNTANGILIRDAGTDLNLVSNNHIGTNQSGNSSIANAGSGVRIDQGASNNIIGGDRYANEGNLISGNDAIGVFIKDSTTSGNTVAGNLIGTDNNGTQGLANGSSGITISDAPNTTIGGSTIGYGNVISGNTSNGISVQGSASSSTTIIGNHIGTDLTGNAAIANGSNGVLVQSDAADILVGGSGANEGNLISGNTDYGIYLSGTDSVKVQGNKIGTDTLGTSAVANGGGGITVLTSDRTTIGVGTADSAAAGNVISGNTQAGVTIESSSTNNLVAGNVIGMAVGGMASLSNGSHGISINSANNVIGGSNSAQRNVIGSNGAQGIRLSSAASGTLVLGNYIGVASDGSNAANNSYGIHISSSANTIGGTTPNDHNTIANNLGAGVALIPAAQDNAILGNSIYANQGLAIDLGDDWISSNDTANQDADNGSNSLQNFPVVSHATLIAADTLTLQGEIDSSADSTIRIDVFSSNSLHSSGHGDAEKHLGSFLVTTDAFGLATFSETLNGVSGIAGGDYISTTATVVPALDTYGATSELSESVVISTNNAPQTTGLPNFTVDEDSWVPPIDVTGYFSDVEDGSAGLVYTIDNISDPSFTDSPSISAAGLLTLPLAANANGSTSITITATDTEGEFVSSSFLFTVNAINDLPVITSGDAFAMLENGTAAATVTSTDIDGNAPIYSLVVGEDSPQFSIDSASGELVFLTAPNFETPLDIGGDNIYNVTVEVDDGNATAQQAITIQVFNSDEKPVITPITAATIDEGQAYSQLIQVTDPESAPVQITAPILASWLTLTDNGDGTALLSGTPSNSEVGLTAIVTLQATDGTNNADPVVYTIDVNDVEHAPTLSFAWNHSVNEPDQIVGTLVGNDLDNDTLTYGILSSGDFSAFTIDSVTGELSFTVPTDAENPLDADSNNIYQITVQVTDGNTTTARLINIEVLNVNEPPQFITAPDTTATQDALYSQLVVTSDPEGTPAQITASQLPTWLTLVDNLDGTATLSGTADNADVGLHNVLLNASDGTLSSPALNFTINVANVNDPPVISFPATVVINENVTIVGTVSGTDIDGDTLSYQLENTADAALFTIDATTGELSFITAPDAELPLDIGANNSYNINVQISDGSPTLVSQAVGIIVEDINESEVNGLSDQNTANNEITENSPSGSVVGITAQATDPDVNDTVTYALEASINDFFEIDPVTGVVTTTAALDFEINQIHDVIISAASTDGSITLQTLSIAVTDQNDNQPLITAQTYSIAENLAPNSSIATLTATDPDTVGDLQNWQIVSGNEDSIFIIDPTTGELSLSASADLNHQTTPQYILGLTTTDGLNSSAVQNIVINISDVNEAPIFLSADSAVASELDAFSFAVTSYDADGNPIMISASALPAWLTLSGTNGSGSAILSGTPAHTDVGTQSIELTVNDGTISTTQTFTLIIQDINQSPVFTSLTPNAATQDSDFSHVITAYDPDNNPLSFSSTTIPPWLTLTDNGDGTATLHGTPANNDVGSSIFTVELNDGQTTISQQFSIDVANINDSPEIVFPSSIAINENSSTVGTVTSTDVDGTPLSYALANTGDYQYFLIDATTGDLTFIDAPDAETPNDTDTNNVYEITIQVSDEQLTVTQSVSVEVLDVNEPPVITDTLHTSVEGFTGQIGTIIVTDPENSALTTIEIVGGSGQAAFEIQDGDQIVQTNSLVAGIYTLEVVVTDAAGLSSEATLEIRIVNSDAVVEPPQLGGVEPSISMGSMTDSMQTNNGGNLSEIATSSSVSAAESIVEPSVATPSSEAPEQELIINSSGNIEQNNTIADARFEGSQSRQDAQSVNGEANEGLHQPRNSKSKASTSDLALEILLQESENVMQGFNINLDSLNISTTLTPALLSAISDMSSDADTAAKKEKVQLELAVRAGTVASVGLTVGFITWLMQSGALLTTALSTAPLWRSLDPIPVLISSDDDDDDKERFDD